MYALWQSARNSVALQTPHDWVVFVLTPFVTRLQHSQGVYGQRLELPSMAGFEGCGVVVDSADESVPRGTRVAFRAFGSWAELCTAPAALCIPLDVDTGWSNAAGALVNPLTAYSMVRMAMRRGDKAIVATAAASGLGRQLTRYASAVGIDVVAVVRRAEQMQACREEGALVTLDASAETFDAELKVYELPLPA